MEIGALGVNQNIKSNSLKSSLIQNHCSYKNDLSADTVSFSGNKKEGVEPANKKSSVIHKALIASTNFVVPGLGQAINGQWGKAALYAIGAPVAVFAASMVSLPLAIGVAAVSECAMLIDAYRNA